MADPEEGLVCPRPHNYFLQTIKTAKPQSPHVGSQQRRLHEECINDPPRVQKMDFVELDRAFAPLSKNQEPSIDFGHLWGRKIGGWLDWNELRQRRRVVLLAEASSGKSDEFRNQAEQLNRSGNAAFYLRIEELADQGFEAALDKGASRKFERWRKSSEDGWFFLDSIDEARLNRKSFETALKRFASELDTSLERSHVFISCRVTDWKGDEDRASIGRWLPAWETAKPVPSGELADDAALLDPIFGEKNQTRKKPEADKKPHELLVVQLARLTDEQYRALASAAGVTDIDAFVTGLARNGLEAFAERPGDLLDLADYWQAHKKFGTFAAMVEHGISRKLRETDAHRADNQALSLAKARVGAERLAAALTFGKSFTLRAPNSDPDPSLAAGALDASEILHDWNDAERNALLRRGVFAPATYGRVRFHHRSTQEYLTARWIHHLLEGVSARPEIWKLIFAERYGVSTVVPSLRPATAWLSLWRPELRDEVIRREPLILLRHGDPGSLSLDARERLLLVYAKKHAEADISDDSLDHRALWMFADQKLEHAIRQAWNANKRTDFHFDLLRLIREGAVKGCVDLARGVARNAKADDYHRIVAVQALDACGDAKGLAAVAKALMARPQDASAKLAPAFAAVLYPKFISTDELLRLIARAKAASSRSTGGFANSIAAHHLAAPEASARRKLIGGLDDLCLRPPFVETYQRVSKRHIELAKNLHEIAVHEAKALGEKKPSRALVRLLMAVERAERRDGTQELHALVRANGALNRDLFWADIAEQRANGGPRNSQPRRHWEVYFVGYPALWSFDEHDLPWLYADLAVRSIEDDRRIALSAIASILLKANTLVSVAPKLRSLFKGSTALNEDLESYLTTPEQDATTKKYLLDSARSSAKFAKQKEKDKASWVQFRKRLRSNPALLSNPKNLTSWSAGMFRHKHLTHWLHQRKGSSDEKAPCDWRLLTEGFGRNVAEAYRDGMKLLWRNVVPVRSIRQPGGALTIQWSTILAFGAVALEASEDADWTAHLSDREARIAAQHGCFSDQGYPDWIESLVNSHPRIVLPILKHQVSLEWQAPPDTATAFLYRYGSQASHIQQPVQEILLEQIMTTEAGRVHTLDTILRIIRNLQLDDTQGRDLTRVCRQRFKKYMKGGKEDYALRYLAALLLLEPDRAVDDLAAWLAAGKAKETKARAENTLGLLFERHDPLAHGALQLASVATLEKLLHIAYAYVRPEDDAVHEDSYSPDTRDHAEGARNAILSALLDRPGADAFRALRRASEHRTFAKRQDRFRELARGKAERDAESPAWSAGEVLVFERDHVAPVKTGTDLLRLIVGVLTDIALRLTEGDVTSRPLLERAKDEDEVQNWLVEQMNFRSFGRFHAYREAQVAGGNKPDVIAASTSAACEVAIEVKHGGKGWTARQLEDALRSQLSEDYLKPSTRRHGVLVVTHHRDRRWLSPNTNKVLPFSAVIEWLSGIAETLVENKSGAVEVKCVGINAFLATPTSKKMKAHASANGTSKSRVSSQRRSTKRTPPTAATIKAPKRRLQGRTPGASHKSTS